MSEIHQITDRLDGLTFPEATKALIRFDSYDRTPAMVFVMQRAPTEADRLQVFLDWGNACDAPWGCRTYIAEMMRRGCAEVSLRDLLEPTNRHFYDALPGVVQVWRGCERGRERGLHWSTVRVTAEGFAWGKRARNKTPTLVRAEIPKKHVFAVFVDRRESEIVLDPRRLRQLVKVPLVSPDHWTLFPGLTLRTSSTSPH